VLVDALYTGGATAEGELTDPGAVEAWRVGPSGVEATLAGKAGLAGAPEICGGGVAGFA
jgi:hypothetical protein